MRTMRSLFPVSVAAVRPRVIFPVCVSRSSRCPVSVCLLYGRRRRRSRSGKSGRRSVNDKTRASTSSRLPHAIKEHQPRLVRGQIPELCASQRNQGTAAQRTSSTCYPVSQPAGLPWPRSCATSTRRRSGIARRTLTRCWSS